MKQQGHDIPPPLKDSDSLKKKHGRILLVAVIALVCVSIVSAELTALNKVRSAVSFMSVHVPLKIGRSGTIVLLGSGKATVTITGITGDQSLPPNNGTKSIVIDMSVEQPFGAHLGFFTMRGSDDKTYDATGVRAGLIMIRQGQAPPKRITAPSSAIFTVPPDVTIPWFRVTQQWPFGDLYFDAP